MRIRPGCPAAPGPPVAPAPPGLNPPPPPPDPRPVPVWPLPPLVLAGALIPPRPPRPAPHGALPPLPPIAPVVLTHVPDGTGPTESPDCPVIFSSPPDPEPPAGPNPPLVKAPVEPFEPPVAEMLGPTTAGSAILEVEAAAPTTIGIDIPGQK